MREKLEIRPFNLDVAFNQAVAHGFEAGGAGLIQVPVDDKEDDEEDDEADDATEAAAQLKLEAEAEGTAQATLTQKVAESNLKPS